MVSLPPLRCERADPGRPRVLRDTSYSPEWCVYLYWTECAWAKDVLKRACDVSQMENLEDTKASTGNPVWMEPPKHCSENRKYTPLRKTKVTFCGEGCSSEVKCLANHMQGARFKHLTLHKWTTTKRCNCKPGVMGPWAQHLRGWNRRIGSSRPAWPSERLPGLPGLLVRP